MKVIIEDEYLVSLYKNGKSFGKPKFNSEVESGFIKRVIQIEQAKNLMICEALNLFILKNCREIYPESIQ